jgi:hypothetical protein
MFTEEAHPLVCNMFSIKVCPQNPKPTFSTARKKISETGRG